jgi:hypothetical protein
MLGKACGSTHEEFPKNLHFIIGGYCGFTIGHARYLRTWFVSPIHSGLEGVLYPCTGVMAQTNHQIMDLSAC